MVSSYEEKYNNQMYDTATIEKLKYHNPLNFHLKNSDKMKLYCKKKSDDKILHELVLS